MQKQASAEIRSVISKPVLASFKAAYRTAKCKKKIHLIRKNSVLLTAIIMAETKLVESYEK
jgi:hypothetical protein